MAGHSQFKNIMHRKGAQDAKRAKVFTKLLREITVAVRQGSPDPEMNPRLRSAMIAAKALNIPKDRIEQAIKKSTAANTDNYEDVRYEGYGPFGAAIIVEALTDNRNRTAGEVRSVFTKHGGSLGELGSVSYMFRRVGSIVYDRSIDSETTFNILLEFGADDLEEVDGMSVVSCPVESFHAVRDALEKVFGEPTQASVIWHPTSTIDLGEDQQDTINSLVAALEDIEDVQSVTTNI